MADAATAAAGLQKDANVRSRMLCDLGAALAATGATRPALTALLAAARLCGAPVTPDAAKTRALIVEALARLGADREAVACASIEAPPPMRAALLGWLGAGFARRGHMIAARDTVLRIVALADAARQSESANVDPLIGEAARVGDAIDAATDPGAVIAIADILPIGPTKLGLFRRAALALHKAGNGGGDRGRVVRHRALSLAAIAIRATTDRAERCRVMTPAAIILARYDGAGAVIPFVRRTLDASAADQVLKDAADAIAADGDVSLAAAILPVPPPTDPARLVEAAERHRLWGDLARARDLALVASRIRTAELGNAPENPIGRIAPENALREIAALLARAGDHDAAIAAIQPVALYNRKQSYRVIAEAAAMRGDRAAIARLLPGLIERVTEREHGPCQAPQLLSEMTVALTVAGLVEEAAVVVAELRAAAADPARMGGCAPDPTMLGTVQAAIGDIDAALATAAGAGRMTEPPDAMLHTTLMTAAIATARAEPTLQQLRTLSNTIAASMPKAVPGPKSQALDAIIGVLALIGNIDGAMRAMTELERARDATIAARCDAGWLRISAAQQVAGDPLESLASAFRIKDPGIRCGRLIALAAMAPEP